MFFVEIPKASAFCSMFFSKASSLSFMILNNSFSRFSCSKIKASSLAFNSSLSSCSLYSHLLLHSSSLCFRASSKFWSLFQNSASIYSSLSCNWSLSWLFLSSIPCYMELSISRTTELVLRGLEPSAYSWWTGLTSGEKGNNGLALLCLCVGSVVSPSRCSCCNSVGSSSTRTTSTSLPLPLFLGPFVIPVSVRGDVLGQFSSSSQSSWTPPKIHSLDINPGCGINPLYPPL